MQEAERRVCSGCGDAGVQGAGLGSGRSRAGMQLCRGLSQPQAELWSWDGLQSCCTFRQKSEAFVPHPPVV